MIVEYHPFAVVDLNEAVDYYNRHRAGLGDELRQEVYAAIERLAASPGLYPIVEQGTRRCLVHRFPYAVLFRVLDEASVRVLVIRHHRRRHGYGLRRR